MKNILLLMSFTCVVILSSCSSDRDNVDIKEEWPVNKTIPSELLGSWKINYVMLESDPDYVSGNNQGYYINFKSDNTIEYKDGNKFGGGNQINKISVKKVNLQSPGGDIGIFIDNIPRVINCKKSSKYPGQFEFKIVYPSDSQYYNMILIGTKQ